MKRTLLALMMAAGLAFTGRAASDAERNCSEAMNAVSISQRSASDGGVRVAFLGNSITLHAKAPQIGWTNEWGMAASAAERDYVHLVTKGIEQETGRKADVLVRNIADFERGFREYDITNGLGDVVGFAPDYLIVAIGENVPDLAAEADRLAYRKAVENLLGLFMRGQTRPNVVVRGVFWKNDAKDEQMAHAASDFGVPFVRTDVAGEPGMMATGLFAHAGVAAHPGDKGMAETARRILEAFFPTNSGYAVWMNGNPVKVRPIRISAMPFNQWAPGYQRPVDQTEIAGFVAVESDGAAEFRVRPDRGFRTAVVRPLSAGIIPVVKDGEVRFRVPKCGYYSLELDGLHRPLEIFVDPRRDFTAERKAANIVFGPGLHEPKIVKLRSHDRVYIDREATVVGSFQAEGVEDVEISGPGVISGARNRRDGDNCYRDGQASAIRIIDSRKIRVDGPIVVDSACWMVEAFNSSDLEFSHLKITGAWRYNTDGIDICNSQRVRISDSYIHSFDDAIVLKGIMHDASAPVEDIRVERCVCWCSWGRTLEIGLETWAPRYRNIVFEDCDLIHNSHGAISVHLGGPAPVEDATYRNIRIEYDRSETPPVVQCGRETKYDRTEPWSGNAIVVENGKMYDPESMYARNQGQAFVDRIAAEPYGSFRRLTFDGISIFVGEGAAKPSVGVHLGGGVAPGEIVSRNVVMKLADGTTVPLKIGK